MDYEVREIHTLSCLSTTSMKNSTDTKSFALTTERILIFKSSSSDLSESLHLLPSMLMNSYWFCNPSRIPTHMSLVGFITSEENDFLFCLLLYDSSEYNPYESNFKNVFKMFLLSYSSKIVAPVLPLGILYKRGSTLFFIFLSTFTST